MNRTFRRRPDVPAANATSDDQPARTARRRAVLVTGGMVALTSPAQAGSAPGGGVQAAVSGAGGDVSISAGCGYSGGHPVLSYGSRGSAVSHAQCLLRGWGWNIAQDGIFGPGTQDAVMAAQDACGIAVDGVRRGAEPQVRPLVPARSR
ncbi:peptidoglycan-binding domain-containing protein [Streptomyces mayteni]